MNKQTGTYSLSIAEANWKSLLIVLPIAVLYILAYRMLWSWEKTAADFLIPFNQYGMALFFLIAGICLHELLHGITWIAKARLDWNAVKYGFKLSGLAPYAHCKKPISAKAYRWGIIAPGLILGILPFLTGLLAGHAGLASFGFIFTLAAGGDFLMLWVIRDIPRDRLVKDHPSRIGCIIVD